MGSYVVRRLPSALIVLFVASIIIFGVLRLVPGDPATVIAGGDASQATLDSIRSQFGLDQPIIIQYFQWLTGFLTFDFGTSYVIGGQISNLVINGAGNTVFLAVSALLLAVLLSVPLAIAAVIWPSRILDSIVNGGATLSIALPPFVTGVLLVLVFAVTFPVLPAGGTPPEGFWARPDITIQYLILPALCLALPIASVLLRFLVESLRTESEQPYVLTARASGIPRRRIVTTGALRNALPTFVTVLGLQVGGVIGGAILVEAIFAWPGLGQLLVQSIGRRDYPVVQVLLLLSVTLFVLIQLVTDLIHAYLDPRIRIGGR